MNIPRRLVLLGIMIFVMATAPIAILAMSSTSGGWASILRGWASAQNDPELEAIQVGKENTIGWFGLNITNKGRAPIKIIRVQINERENKECIFMPDKSLDVGDTYNLSVFGGCGNLVRASVKSDQGDIEFNW